MINITSTITNFLDNAKYKLNLFKPIYILLDSSLEHLNELSCKLSKCKDNIVLNKKLHTHILDSLFKDSKYILWAKDLEDRYVYISDKIVKDNKINSIRPTILGLTDLEIMDILKNNGIDPSNTFWNRTIKVVETTDGVIEFCQTGGDKKYCNEIDTLPLIIDNEIVGYCGISKLK